MATNHNCEKCGRTFKGAKGLAWHELNPQTCAGAAKQPAKPVGNDWHPGVTCELAHPDVAHMRATRGKIRFAWIASHPVAHTSAKPAHVSKAAQRKLDKAAAVANAKAGAHDVQPHASAARGVRVHTGAIDPATMPLCGKNGRALHGAALANAQRTLAAERIMPTPTSEMVAEIVKLVLAAMPIAS